MAKTLTEQYRRWTSTGTDPRQFGDGAPMHSSIPFDMIRGLNNLQAICEPSFGFAYDQCGVINNIPGGSSYAGGDGLPSCTFTMTDDSWGNDGTALLCQLPILVPIQASALAWSFAFYRRPRAGVDLPAVDVNVTNIKMYLASEPCGLLHDPIIPNPAPVESGRLFHPSYIRGQFSSLDIGSIGATSGGPGGAAQYTSWMSELWTNFAPAGLNNINDRARNPWAYLLVSVDFNTMSEGESITAAELSWWAKYT